MSIYRTTEFRQPLIVAPHHKRFLDVVRRSYRAGELHAVEITPRILAVYVVVPFGSEGRRCVMQCEFVRYSDIRLDREGATAKRVAETLRQRVEFEMRENK